MLFLITALLGDGRQTPSQGGRSGKPAAGAGGEGPPDPSPPDPPPEAEGEGSPLASPVKKDPGREDSQGTPLVDGVPLESPLSQVEISLSLAPGARVRVTVESLPPSDEAGDSQTDVLFEGQGFTPGPVTVRRVVELPTPSRPVLQAQASLPVRLRSALRSWPYSLGKTLFGFGLAIYLLTRLIGLADFPIYFFTDEAIQTVAASNLIHNGFRDEEHVLLPAYLKNGQFYNLSASVYLQVIPYLLFGKSVFVTRAVSVLVSLLAAVAVGLILRNIFEIPYWWSGVLLLSIVPAWFLHSRTAFETVLFVSFYAAFLYAYLLYRKRAAGYFSLAVVFGALAFYSYAPGQFVIAITGLLLLVSDARYHWENRKVLLRGIGILVLLAIPYIRFRVIHPAAPFDQLRILDSYWIQPLPLAEKLSRYASEYLYGLSPGYWFLPNERDLARHLMKGYGNILLLTLPFAALGFLLALKRIRSPEYRAVLIVLLAAPSGAALVQIGITRALVFVIPATLLTAFGVSQAAAWLEARNMPRGALSFALVGILTLANFGMLRDALANGPTWYHDYGLGGMQYGARQLFPEIKDYLEQSPGTHIILSPAWANGTDVVARFFLSDPLPIQMGSIEGHLFQRLPLDDNTLFIMIPEEYQKAIESGKFKDIRVEKTMPYPDGQPGFFFVRLRYVDNIDEILAAERAARRVLQTAEVEIDGETVQVKYPLLDMGEVANMFDGNPDTLARTLEANPAVIELTFPEQREISSLSVIIGSAELQLKALVYPSPEGPAAERSAVLKGSVDHPEASLAFGEPLPARVLRLEFTDPHQSEPAHIHFWEITLHSK